MQDEEKSYVRQEIEHWEIYGTLKDKKASCI